PNIVQVFEVGESQGRSFLALEYCGGGTLRDRLGGTPLPPREAAELLEVLARAMHAAHEKGVIHRDLKPGNVLLTEDGTYKVSDFGLARKVEEAGQTLSGAIVGTPSYMAPEQARGHSKEVGPAVDVYALGAILYECLTGRPPFKAASPLDTLLQVQRDEPVPPSQLQSRTPRDLETICLKCLLKEPGERYASARELAEDLARFRADQPILARPVGRLERARRWCRRNPWLAGLTAAVLLLLVTVAVGSTVAALHLNEALGNAETNLLRAVDAEKDGKDKLFQAYVAQAHAGRNSRRLGQRYASLESLQKAARLARELKLPPEQFQKLRHEAIACLALPDLRLLRATREPLVGTLWGTLDDTLEHYAFTHRSGYASVCRLADDQEVTRLPTYGGVDNWPYLSRDGCFLAVWAGHPDGRFKWWRLKPGAPAIVREETAVFTSALSPDSRQVALARADGTIDLHELATGRHRQRLRTGQSPNFLTFHPGNRQLAVSHAFQVDILDLETGETVASLPLSVVTTDSAWHPDGRTLAVVGVNYNIYLWDVPARKQTVVLEGEKNGGVRLAFNRRGDVLVSGGWAGVVRFWDPITGQQLFNVPGHPNTPHFSPDDRRLVGSFGGTWGSWEVAADREYRTLVRDPVHGKGIYDVPSISPDGQLLAVGMRDGVGLWDLASGRAVGFLPVGYSPHALFEPSGKLLTNSVKGLLRWPVRAVPGGWRVGPPARLAALQPACQIAQSHDGQVLANAQFKGGVVLRLDRPGTAVRLGPHADVRYISVSPDGKWVATGSFGGTGAKVWEAGSGKLVRTLQPEQPYCGVQFSPDGKWLAVSSGERCRLWTVGTWESRPGPQARIWGPPAFTPDGKVMALNCTDRRGVVGLFEPATGRELARLEDPNQDGAAWMTFSPDGTQLVVVNIDESQTIHVWDLRAIRRGLKALDLDCDAAPYPAALAGAAPAFPRAEIVMGDQGG
ncbi:MAG: serine/threonine-protein kinase, partial [Gemmataceae bacterium]|nr:serine/threonine-protein kinase [Gemmataceae bacterium]